MNFRRDRNDGLFRDGIRLLYDRYDSMLVHSFSVDTVWNMIWDASLVLEPDPNLNVNHKLCVQNVLRSK